jgi:hypothetical protein
LIVTEPVNAGRQINHLRKQGFSSKLGLLLKILLVSSGNWNSQCLTDRKA